MRWWTFGFIKCWEFLEWLRTWYPLGMDSAPWSSFCCCYYYYYYYYYYYVAKFAFTLQEQVLWRPSYCGTGLRNLLCGAVNVDKTWPVCGQYEIQHTERGIDTYSYVYNFTCLYIMCRKINADDNRKFLFKNSVRVRLRCGYFSAIIGAFAKLREATVSFVMSVCPYGSTRLPVDGFWWNLIFKFFRKFVKNQVSLKSDKNNGYAAWRLFHIFDIMLLNYF
jgi:hypothetical protein